jgi:hypothetical protein
MSSKKSEMKFITDRACYNVCATYSVEYRIQGVNLSLRTIQSRIKKNIETQIKRHFSDMDSVPFVVAHDLQLSVYEVIDEYESDTCLCKTKFDMDFTFEETENKPEPLARELITFLYATANTEKITNHILEKIEILSPEKGYIQSDRTLYFPEP